MEDLVWNLTSELRDLHIEYTHTQMDQDEEVGALYVKGDEVAAEKLAQVYGERFDKIIKKQESLKKQLENANKQLDDAKDKMIDFRNKLWV